MSELKKTRIDKWLWATRWFKTRTMATNACNSGKVKMNDKSVKASTIVEVGQQLVVRKNNIRYTLLVEKIIEKRVGAPLARECYTDLTPPEEKEISKSISWFNKFEVRDKGVGRPTKKDRRDIERFKIDQDDDYEL